MGRWPLLRVHQPTPVHPAGRARERAVPAGARHGDGVPVRRVARGVEQHRIEHEAPRAVAVHVQFAVRPVTVDVERGVEKLRVAVDHRLPAAELASSLVRSRARPRCRGRSVRIRRAVADPELPRGGVPIRDRLGAEVRDRGGVLQTITIVVRTVEAHLRRPGVDAGDGVVAVGAIGHVADGPIARGVGDREVAVAVAVDILVPRGQARRRAVRVVREAVAILVHVERIADLGGTGVDAGVAVVAVGVVHHVADGHAARRGGDREVAVRVAVGIRVERGAAARLVDAAGAVVVHAVADLRRHRVDGGGGVVAVEADVRRRGDDDVVLRVAGHRGIDAHVIGVTGAVVREDVGRLRDDRETVQVVIEGEHRSGADREVAADAHELARVDVAVLGDGIGVARGAGRDGEDGKNEGEETTHVSSVRGLSQFP